ncbi:FAD-binding dehydrogenase [Streptomyces tsukubensis]|uniref:FAD-binding dehydrogenase n=1 Tax=Streptomyces tsukubensis TaxID=83656 RepID=A0A1V4AFJ1_9ACTN|nr:FAD-binding dehydrogenase [Streptomyces tsukubensis]OON82317.1 FAD-binding dehydrogenase [Streptomyces tsukubensis]QFR92807.1 FAD-binding dehydrogenase [Streptomyces tsukubensis]
MAYDADVIVIGAGLAGLAATAELVDAGRSVILLDQEPEQSLGGQAHWSFGGLFFVDSPEQRRLRVKDSRDLALQDWLGTAGFDRDEDYWPRRWAEAYVDFAAGEKRSWLRGQGVRFFPVVGWAERGGYDAQGHGNSVPRFHITWGTGPGIVAPFERRVRAGAERGLVTFRFRHRVTGLSRSAGGVDTVSGEVLAPSGSARGAASSRKVTGSFELRAQAVIVSSGGIGGNHDLVRAQWPERLGSPPQKLLSGVPAHVDGAMLKVTGDAGGHLINGDRMWHYTEGIENWNPIWSRHGIRILPGPSSLWLDADGNRLPVPLFPGFDTLGTLEHIMRTGHGHTWFVLNQRIIGKEFTLSGSEQNPDLTGKSVRGVIDRARSEVPGPVKAFMDRGADFVVEKDLASLVRGMNALTDKPLIDEAALRRTLVARDREIANPFTKDLQVTAIRGARSFLGDRLIRAAAPHRILDPKAGPLVAVRLNILTRKSLGGLETDLSSRVLTEGGDPLPGVYAAGEAAGFGGGGVHGYRSLEGTFLGGCLFSGRAAGRAAAKAVG